MERSAPPPVSEFVTTTNFPGTIRILEEEVPKVNAKVTIITVVKNSLLGLKKTEASLKGQNYGDWLWIVVVGESTDGTNFYAQSLRSDSRVQVFHDSEPGIYQAMNLGMNFVDTEYVWFMHGGDVFVDKILFGHSQQG